MFYGFHSMKEKEDLTFKNTAILRKETFKTKVIVIIMKKIFIFVYIITCTFTLAACSFNTDKNQKALSGDSNQIIARIRKETNLPAMFQVDKTNVNAKDILKNYYDLDIGITDDFCILMPQNDTYTELAVFKTSDKEQRKEIIQSIEKRKNDLYCACKAYAPEITDRFSDNNIIEFKNAVVFVLIDNKNTNIVEFIDRISAQMV